jgi:hypothetical protein
MLKRKGNDIRHTLKRRRTVWSREPFGDNDPDPPMGLSSIPVALLQDFLVELREAEIILIPILINFYRADGYVSIYREKPGETVFQNVRELRSKETSASRLSGKTRKQTY